MRVFLTGLVLLPLLCGCGSKDQVTYNSGGMTHTFSEGNKAVSSNFPLPIYPNSKPSGSVATEGKKGADASEFLMLSSSDSVEAVSKFYRSELKKNGWQIDRIDTMGQMVNFAFHKDKLEGSAMVSADGHNTSINLSVDKSMGMASSKPDDQNYTPDKLTPPTD